MTEIKGRIEALLEHLSQNLYEKEHVIAMALLASIAGESIFLLGPPGTAKSMIGRRMKGAFQQGKAFEYLMSRFSTPDEIFGPVSITALKDENKYERVTDGYLPRADVVFLDEIWKAGPSIQNALLTVLNEKVYLNGMHEMHLPLKLIIAASNELPAEGENLEALWDRFLIRYTVHEIQDDRLFEQMITSSINSPIEENTHLSISGDELKQWQAEIEKVSIPRLIFNFIHTFRQKITLLNEQWLNEGGDTLYLSDRRWKKIVHLWRTSAWLNGRTEVDLSDVLLLSTCAWDRPEQQQAVDRCIAESIEACITQEKNFDLQFQRLEALRIEAKKTMHQSPHFKVVRSFFYQIETSQRGKMLLVYKDEYDLLEDDKEYRFFSMVDKKKADAQIIRLYDEKKYPNIPESKLIGVKKTMQGIVANNYNYTFIKEANENYAKAETSVYTDEALNTVVEQVKHTAQKSLQWMDEMVQSSTKHLFLNTQLRSILLQAEQKLKTTITSLQIDAEEIRHTAKL